MKPCPPFILPSEETAAQTQLNELKKKTGSCADCHDVIAPNADLAHGLFLCNRCATYHRSTRNCRIQTVAFTKWTLESVNKFQALQGLERNQIVEARLKDSAVSDRDQRRFERYLEMKYAIWETAYNEVTTQPPASFPAPSAHNEKPRKKPSATRRHKAAQQLDDDFFSAAQTDLFADNPPSVSNPVDAVVLPKVPQPQLKGQQAAALTAAFTPQVNSFELEHPQDSKFPGATPAVIGSFDSSFNPATESEKQPAAIISTHDTLSAPMIDEASVAIRPPIDEIVEGFAPPVEQAPTSTFNWEIEPPSSSLDLEVAIVADSATARFQGDPFEPVEKALKVVADGQKAGTKVAAPIDLL